jgi:hypothetical protein
VVPKWRRYALAAAVAPPAFAVCSIGGVLTILLTADHFEWSPALSLDKPMDSAGRVAAFLIVYAVLGAIGAGTTGFVANRVQHYISRVWNSQT